MSILDSIQKIEREQAEIQIKLDEALTDLNDLKDKKYNFWDVIKGTKRHDSIQKKETQDYIFLLQTQLDTKEKELDIIMNYIKNEKEEFYEKTI